VLEGLAASSANGSHDGHAGPQHGADARRTDLTRGIALYAEALDKMRQGLCVFDGEQRLLLFNRRYAEMYKLRPESLRLGMTLRDVIDLRYAAGTGPDMAREQYAAWRDAIAVADTVADTVVELGNGSVH
jgi:PAS domain-containing protein